VSGVDLVQWLNAQLDTDERLARAAHGPVDGPLGKKWWTAEDFKTRLCDDQIHMGDADHMAGWSPARVLREIDGRRRTLIRCEEAMLSASPMLVHFAKQTVREMALSYEGAPGYAEALASFE
jgi:hypothetical protein